MSPRDMAHGTNSQSRLFKQSLVALTMADLTTSESTSNSLIATPTPLTDPFNKGYFVHALWVET